jgi:hypothetical protein
VLLLLLGAGAARVVAVRAGGSDAHRLASAVGWPAVSLALYVGAHPFVLRRFLARAKVGTPVSVAWSGRDRSGQPWLVLGGADGRAWQARPRQGPVEYPLLQYRGNPWLYPPAFDGGPVRGTLVRPRWTRRRGLVLHALAGAAAEGAGDWEVLTFGSGHEACLGVHLRSLRRLRPPPTDRAERAEPSGPAGPAEPIRD